MIKIIGGKIIRDNGFLVLKIKNNVFKIPLIFAAFREIKEERRPLIFIKKDKHFFKYLLDYKFFFSLQITPYFTPLVYYSNKMCLIEEYFIFAFKNSHEWKMEKLKNLIDVTHYLQFISRYFFKDINLWKNFLNTMEMPQSSIHGDFMPDNILVDGDRLFFIDWIHYKALSSRYFDLFNYYIFSIKNKNVSWMKAWERELSSSRSNLFGIEIKKKYFLAYAVWKVAEELKILEMRKKLYPNKIKKYTNFIEILLKSLNNFYEN